MQHTGNADSDTNNTDKNDNRAPNAQWWMIACGVTVVLILLVVSAFLPNMTERVKFFTANALSAFVLTAIIVQAYIYTKQWKAMQSQLDITKRQQESVEQQLILLGVQANAMLSQWNIMSESLVETRNIVRQNERAIKAAEEAAAIAKEAFYVGEAPYFGITKITFEWILNNVYAGTKGGGRPRVRITFLNGGKTPAWHLSVVPNLIVGDSPEKGTWLTLNAVHDRECPDAENTFYPSGAEKCIKYEGRNEFGSVEIEAIRTQTTSLFLIVNIGYTDMRNDRQTRTLYRRLNPITDRFGDYLAVTND